MSDDLAEDLDALAKEFAEKLRSDPKVKTTEKIKGLQALTSYYSAREKHRGKKSSTDGFGNFKKLFEQAPATPTEEEYDA